MGRIAFLFSGQGAQKAGMAKEFYDTLPEVRKLFDAAEEYRPGTLAQCFNGTEEELKLTGNTQPCLYLADLSAAMAVQEAGFEPVAAAGFSLGEIPALAFSGAYGYLDGFKIACKRGEIMAEAAKEVKASMTAVVKLDNTTVEALCEKYEKVFPVNYNSPGQLVVSGMDEELEKFKEDVRAAGGKCLPLAVGGGFHSPFMDGACERFAEYLSGVDVSQPALPCWSNRTGKPYFGDTKKLMAEQINSPVRWEEIIRSMAGTGIDTFIETGVGMVLSKLTKKIDGTYKSWKVENLGDISILAEGLR